MEKQYKCTNCNKKLANKYTLIRHKKSCDKKTNNKIQINNINNICNYCNKQLSTKYTYIAHINKYCKIKKVNETNNINIDINNKINLLKKEIAELNNKLEIEINKNKEIKKDIKHKKKKEIIPTTVKNTVWRQEFNDNIEGKCICCKVENISKQNFHCGHIVSEKNGGKVNLDNLKPVCASCNLSMGTMNMNDFIKKYGFDKLKS